MQGEKVCYEVIINLYSCSTVYLIYFVPYFFMEDQEPILGRYSWRNPFETSQGSEKSEAPTHGWALPGSGPFFHLPNWGNIFCSLFPGGGWVCFLRNGGISVGPRPCSSLEEQAPGLLASDMPRNIKEHYIFGAVSWYSPASLFVVIWKKLLSWKEGQTISRRTKPGRAGRGQISMKHSCCNSYLNGLLSSWTTFLWPATAERCSQGEITSNLLRADERCVCVSVLLVRENKHWTRTGCQDVGQSLSAAEQIPRTVDWHRFLWSHPASADLQQPKINTNTVVSVTNFDALLLNDFFEGNYFLQTCLGSNHSIK